MQFNFAQELLRQYVSGHEITNIKSSFKDIIGVSAHYDKLNENEKLVGLIILINVEEKTKFDLKDIVEFRKDKIKYKMDRPDQFGNIFILINPHWCKFYNIRTNE